MRMAKSATRSRSGRGRSGWSPFKSSIISFVRDHPGCCKWDVAAYVTRSPRRCPSRQYYIVNTALRNGWIEAKWAGNRWCLTVPSGV